MRAGLNFQKEVRSDNHKEAIEPKGMLCAIYERVNFKLKDRKKELQEKLFSFRFSRIQPQQNKIANCFAPEEHKINEMDLDVNPKAEGEKEVEIGDKRYANVSMHFKRRPKKLRRKCWTCGSPSHIKKECPNILCFYCRKPGHLKAHCWRRKLDYIFARLKENIHVKDKKKLKQEKKKQERQQRKFELQILHARFNNLDCFLKKTEKGDKPFLKWKNFEIGEFKGTGHPNQIIQKYQQHQYEDKLMQVYVKKEIPLSRFTLYGGFSNWCGCGEIDLGNDVFSDHVKRHHHGKIPVNSHLNRPFWLDWINFNSEEIEYQFCYTLSDLTISDDFVK